MCPLARVTPLSNGVGNTKSCVRRNKGLLFPASPPFAKAVEIEVNHRRGVECERLTKDEAADDCYAEWPAQLGPDTVRNNEWQRPEECSDCGHQDWAETQEARLINSFARPHAFRALRLEREVHHQNRVLLYDSDKQQEPDHCDHAEICAE